MSAVQQLVDRLKLTPDSDVARFRDLMQHALPDQFRENRENGLTKSAVVLRRSVHHEVLQLTDHDAQEILDYMIWEAQDADTLSPDELAAAEAARAEIVRGHSMSLAALREKLGL